MSETRITVEELRRRLPEVLRRVEDEHEEFLVENDGEVFARLSPTKPKAVTFKDLVELLERIPPPDDQFADDLESIQAEQPYTTVRESPPKDASDLRSP